MTKLQEKHQEKTEGNYILAIRAKISVEKTIEVRIFWDEV